MPARAALRGAVVFLLVMVLGSVAQLPAFSVTKSQVQEACADSQAQYQAYLSARSEWEEAAQEWERTQQEIAAVQYQRDRVAQIVERRQGEIDATSGRIQDLAVELYMQGGGGNPTLVLFADSVDELITGSEFLSAATGEDISSLDDMVALRADLDRLQQDLLELDGRLNELAVEQQTISDQALEKAEAEKAAFAKLSGRCQTLQARFEAELAAAAARAKGRSAGVGPISGFVCPFPGSSFIDSWGFPRSGGRRHKGVDMMGPYGGTLVAAGNGYVSLGNGGLGGRTVWLVADNGYAYYYAHLSDYAVSSGQRVSAGDPVGYNGSTGNASGGAPHLHFEIHPGGRGSGAVNPYPTVAAACR